MKTNFVMWHWFVRINKFRIINEFFVLYIFQPCKPPKSYLKSPRCDHLKPYGFISQKLTQNLKNNKMAKTPPAGLKWKKNKTTLFSSILKVGGNKVVFYFFDLCTRGRVMAVFSIVGFWVNFCVMSLPRVN